VKPALLADENFPRSVIAGLRENGYDVLAMAEHAPQTEDRGVLALARQTSRWLLTFDSDFGDLIFRDGELPPPGILYFRLHPIVADRLLALAARALAAPLEAGFVVVAEEGERRRPFSPPNRGPT
jgi:predicted nuclease of predicted toxin-antitoxin system